MSLDTVGVIGAGVTGCGVAQDLACHDFSVFLVDISYDILARAKKDIKNGIRFQRLFSEESPDSGEALDRITFSTSYGILADIFLVIECIDEIWDMKRDLLSLLDGLCRKECIFASSTSAIPISRLAAATKRPAQVIGIHFMNPVPHKALVELIPGVETSGGTIEKACNLLERLGKSYVLVKDSPGFVSNRVLMGSINEAAALLEEGVATAAEIDRIFRGCFEHKMGPLETADLIGLDTVLRTLEVLDGCLPGRHFRPAGILREHVESGRLGRKSGRGFYDYC
ncbi:MAG: 3-hydroxyacyl-CoA dehydrogenase NAD-binding domain-containing protein [Candidatus Eremiobacteraeota bacterium]|nr:3-hydroxyacyl-CoA dehydrogenase NAD-binding domain-containing protein [Candidatus Eremiobacteraeota bacterium]